MARKKLVLCDTNILIHILRGRADIKVRLDEIGFQNICISVITKAELLHGAKNKLDSVHLNKWLSEFVIYGLNEEVSNIFHGLVLNYSLSHKISIPDSLIAATSIAYGIPLYTENMKDFRFVPEMTFHRPRV